MGKSFDILQKMVVNHSQQSTWEESVHEWDIIACSIDEKKKKRCICGQEGLKYCFAIKNRYNRNIIYPIGSSCILKFERRDLKQTLNIYEQLFSIRTKYYNREKITLKDFSGALLQFFYEKGVFKPTRYNQYNPENDYKFMVQMYHQVTDLTERQQSKVNALIINYIIPYIQTLENPS